MQKKKIILSIIIGIILIGIIGIFIFLYYEFEESEDDYPITSVRSFGEYDHPPGLNKLPLDTDTKIATMEKQIPQLIEVEEVKKERLDLRFSGAIYIINMIFQTGIRFSMQKIKNLRMP